MATAQRTYVVSSDREQRLVIATSQAQAIRHVVSRTYHAAPADGITVAELLEAGVTVERAGQTFGNDLGI